MAYSEPMWQEAKRKCRLNNADLELAKRLNLNPSKSERQKPTIPVPERDEYL